MHTNNSRHTSGAAGEKLYDLCMIENFCRGIQEQIKKMLQLFIDKYSTISGKYQISL